MRTHFTSFASIAVYAGLALTGVQIERCFAARLKVLPRLAGTRMPTAPEQDSSWVPPRTKLPNGFVSATEVLFKQGLADPRGCEYREIEVATGSCWGGAGVHEVHGWVIPAREGEKQRFAVCWNGLVYPVVSIGKKADCQEDIATLFEKDREWVEKRRAEHREREASRRKEAEEKNQKYYEISPHIRWERAWAEGHSISHDTMLPSKSTLLLRLGHADLAETLWEQWFAGNTGKSGKDPYLILATDWMWALFDRAVCAHMRGDDNLALVSARTLIPIDCQLSSRRVTAASYKERRGPWRSLWRQAKGNRQMQF